MQELLDTLRNANDFLNKNTRWTVAIASIMLLSVAGYYLITYRQMKYHKAAHAEMFSIQKIYDLPVEENGNSKSHDSFSSEEEKWSKVRELSHKSFDKFQWLQRYKSCGLGAYFPIYEVNALLKLGRFEEAVHVMSRLVEQLPDNPIKDFAKVRFALMLLDSDSEQAKNEGLTVLEGVANSNGYASDQAYYWLGEYHWIKGRTQEAKSIWNTLVSEFSTAQIGSDGSVRSNPYALESPWVSRAKERLELIQ